MGTDYILQRKKKKGDNRIYNITGGYTYCEQQGLAVYLLICLQALLSLHK